MPVGWFMPMSYRRRITHEDTYKLRNSNSSEAAWAVFEPIWQRELQKPEPSLVKALLRTFLPDMLIILLTWMCWSGLQYTNPLILPYLAQYFVFRTLPSWWGYIYMTAIWASSFMAIILFNATLYRTWVVGSKVRSVLINLIYRKALKVTPAALGSRGMILNLMSTDAQIILDTFPQFVMGLISPIQIGVTIGLLAREIGVYCLIPLGILLLAFPFLGAIGKRLPIARMSVQKAADVRVKLTTEFISAIRIVKYYAWERPFLAKIDESREREIVDLKRIATYNAILLAALIAIPSLAMGFTIFFYAIGHSLGLGSIFSAIAYLAYLRFPFVFMPLAFTFGAQYIVSLGRIRDFCMNKDIEEMRTDGDSTGEGGMSISDASFTWEHDPIKAQTAPIVLEGIDLDVQKGKLVMVVGGVGSGKSSIASAFLKELRLLKGQVRVSSPIGYASQEPFLINTTIRDNIIFGQTYDPLWYQQVVNACALVTDFEMFPAGDLTEIAEKGSNLSGGQRQRLNVARAMYSNRDLYVFDDPFSAVDAHVGDHMFKNVCLPLRDMERGILLITNQLQFLPWADSVVVLDSGKISEQGSYQELIAQKGALYNLALEYGLVHDEKTKAELGLSMSANVKRSAATGLRKSADSIDESPLGEDVNLKTQQLTPEELAARDEKNRQLGALITKESSQNKAVAHAVYAFYFLSGSLLIFILACIFNILRTGFNVGQNVWLSRWANPQYNGEFDKATRMGAYIAMVFGEVIFILAFVFIMIKFTINSSRRIHRRLVGSIAHATTAFFDKTPLGRLLSRFSKDMNLIDTMLSLQLQQAMNLGFLVLGVVVNVAIASKYAVIIVVVALAYFITMLLLYRRTSIQVQRLEAVSRAPIFTHFGETLEGLPTVRAYDMAYNFVVAIMNKVDYNATDFLTLRRMTQWFNMATNQVVNIIITGVFLMLILFRNYSPESYNVSLAVSACANSVSLISILGAFAFLFAEFEARMNAPERVLEYNNVEQEKPYEIEETKPAPEWPQNGKIEFDSLTIAYKPGVPVLHGLSATIKPREKVGIVGRTGAGKSTLITALFRTTEPASGSVKIDDVDIDTIGLFDLRRRLSIIPQVPQLFMGSVRYNLDPFGAHQDDEIWHVLDMVHLKDFVSQTLPDGLDSIVEENGGNFSVGQRQLISMARCLLLDSHILLLDEATASLDVQSDALLQKMIRKHFVNRTVLTIAHRLITIIDCDRVLVLDAGRIVEFDSPKKLLENHNGIFYGMVQATGKATASHLTAIANGKLRVADVLAEDPDILEESSIEEIPERKRRKKKAKKAKKAKIVEEEAEAESSE
jgi:ABC-type multidrug transport system fused ATPase/permease subunit